MAVKEEELNRGLEDLRSSDHDRQNKAFHFFIGATDEPVDWAYKVWADLMELLRSGDNRQQAIAAQVLCNLAKSDPKNRMRKDLAALLEVTRDERFVTARHCMQSLWKVGVAGLPAATATLKFAVPPATMVWSAGGVVMDGRR